MKIITRQEWGARPPKNTPYNISVPTPELWLRHSAGSGSDATAVRAIQDFHMDVRGWNDIAYSFLIDDDDDPDVYEGRGAGIAGGHTKGHNTVSHAICIIGNFTTTPPKTATIDKLVELVRYGYARGWWPLGFTGGHRDVSPGNECPGTALYNQIPTLNERIETVPIYEDEGQKDGVDDAFLADWAQLLADGVFTVNTDPDRVTSAERLGAFLVRFRRDIERDILAEVDVRIAAAVAAAGAGELVPGTKFTAEVV